MCPGRRWPATASWPSAESPSSPPISPPTKTTPTLPTTEPNSLFSPPTFVFHPQLSLVQSFPSAAISISVLLSAIVAISWYVRPFQCLFLPPSPSLPQPSRNFEIPFEFSHPPSPSWPGLSSVIETSLSGFADFPTPKLALLPLWIPRCPNPSRLCPPSTRCLFSQPNLSHLFPPFPTFYHTFSLPPKHHSPLTFVATVTACIASHPLTAPVSTDSNILDLHIQNGTYLDFSRHPWRRWPRPFRRSLLRRVQGGRPRPGSQLSQLRRLGPGHPHH